jgi:uncharacterized protein
VPGRRRRARCIGLAPGFICFKPCGKPGRGLQSVELRIDELEALRLSDLEGLYQEECARRMQISRTTLSRTLAQAHRKVADALPGGKRLVIAAPSEDERARGPQMAAPTTDQAGVGPPGDVDAD